MSAAGVLNWAWMWKCTPELHAFRRATRRVAETQSEVLHAIVQANRDSWFGRRHGFESIRTPSDYQSRVPVSCYDDYRGAIERIAAGETSVLTREPVTLLEPTSGSTSGEKLIPYTRSLRMSFQRGVATWMADLLRSRPATRTGRAYWSISPPQGPRRWSASGLPIGFDADAAYLGTLERYALGRILVMPSTIARVDDFEAFRYCTLLKLLAAPDLSLISVWSPSFLTTLLGSLENWVDPLSHDLRSGTLSGAPRLPPDLARVLRTNGPRNRRRADEVSAVLRSSGALSSKLLALWPRLALISCWTDASAAGSSQELAQLFPRTEIQPKGLLATEGFVSLPLCDAPAPALALRSHFFEFDPSTSTTSSKDAGHRLLFAHELERGGRYRVVLTNSGGLYRYQLHDEIQVVDFANQCALLRFTGKADRTSDLVGEKLNDSHVGSVLERTLQRHGLAVRFALLVPVTERAVGYRLYLQLARPADMRIDWARYRTDLDDCLAENPHYHYARGLGQLLPVEVYWREAGGPSASQVYQDQMLSRGIKAGAIKPAALDNWSGWPTILDSLDWHCESTMSDKRRPRRPSPEASH
jgi:hypothetical protein